MLLLARAVPQVSPAVPADVIASVSNASWDGSYTIPIRAGLRTAFLHWARTLVSLVEKEMGYRRVCKRSHRRQYSIRFEIQFLEKKTHLPPQMRFHKAVLLHPSAAERHGSPEEGFFLVEWNYRVKFSQVCWYMGDWKEKENSLSWLTTGENWHSKAQAGCKGWSLALNTDSNSPSLQQTGKGKNTKVLLMQSCTDFSRSTFNNRIMETSFCFLFFNTPFKSVI